MAALALVGIALWTKQLANGTDPATRATWGSIALVLFWLTGLLIRYARANSSR